LLRNLSVNHSANTAFGSATAAPPENRDSAPELPPITQAAPAKIMTNAHCRAMAVPTVFLHPVIWVMFENYPRAFISPDTQAYQRARSLLIAPSQVNAFCQAALIAIPISAYRVQT
jgi:hypothetical protein